MESVCFNKCRKMCRKSREIGANKQREIEDIRTRQQANNQRMAELMEQIGRQREHRSALTSRQNLLRDLERRREGVAQPVQEILKRRDAGQGFACVKGMVGDLIDADVQTAPLIEAALGDMLTAIMVESADQLCAEAPAWRQIAGRTRVICLDQLAPYREDADDTLDQALAAQRSGPRHYRYVTRSGEVLNTDGSLELGDGSRKVGTITRRSELTRLAAEIAETEAQITELTGRSAECDQQAQQLGARQQALRDELFHTQTAHAQANAQWQQTSGQIDKLRGEQPLIQNETQHLHKQAAQCDQSIETLKNETTGGAGK